LFVTLDTARYMKFKQWGTEAVNWAGNVSDVSADVELIVTIVYTTNVMGNAATVQNQTYSLTVLT